MPVFDDLQRASFGGVEFPVREFNVHGGIDYKAHRYPHKPGAKIEKLGRKPYEFDCVVPFHANLIGWPKLWPDALVFLREKFESQKSEDLYIPTIGAVKAICVDWSQAMNAKVRSGEDAHLKFLEDTENDFLLDSIINQDVDIAAQLKDFKVATEKVAPRPSLFDSIDSLILAVSAVGDTAKDAANQVAQKIAQAKELIETADRTLKILTRPDDVAQPIIDSMRDLWLSLDQLERDATSTENSLYPYTVPRTMSVSEISAALYGDGTRGVEVMANNPIVDPFAVRAGSVLQVYGS